MKRITLFAMALLYVGVNLSTAQLFPKVDKPISDDKSMLVVHFAKETDDGKDYENVSNINATGWAPVVKGPDGEIVPFRKYDMESSFYNLYYSENLDAGEYTLIGFYHVYVDYGKLEEYKKEVNRPNFIMSYEPYANNSYHIKQLIELNKPISAKLEAGTIMPLGNFVVNYDLVGGAWGTTDDRWKAKDNAKIVLTEPFDDYAVRCMKNWRTPAWKLWNARNPYEAL